MKTNKLILGASLLFLAGALALSSCKKRTTKEAEEPDKEANTARDNANAENIANDIDAIGGEAVENSSLSEFRSSGETALTNIISVASCATVTGVGTSTITVDFGTTPCAGNDGRKRSGKLFFNLSQSTPTTSVKYRNPGFKMIVTSQNYVVDSNAVTINNKTVENTTSPSIGSGTPTIGYVNLTWRIQSNITIVKPNSGGSITWTCDRTKELTNTNTASAGCYNGQALPINWSKAIVKINGTASGSNAKGESYTVKAIDLVRDFNCSPSVLTQKRHPFISGKIEYTPGSRPTRYFDYGTGTCDFNATVVINGVTYSITLP